MDRMETIERQVRHYADARQTLSGAVARLQVDMGKVKDRHLPRVREAAKALAGAQSTLETLVEQNPELFDRPKTREAHGVRFGFRKQKGKITVASEKNTIALIRRKLPGLVKTLIKVTEKPVKAAPTGCDRLTRGSCSTRRAAAHRRWCDTSAVWGPNGLSTCPAIPVRWRATQVCSSTNSVTRWRRRV